MFRRVIFNLTALIVLICGISAQADEPQVKIVTGDIAPFSMESLSGRGIMHEIVVEIERRLGTKRKPKFYPWPRAQLLTLNHDNHIIFPLTRTEDRETYYDWIIDVTSLDFVFATIGKKVETLDDARQLDSVIVREYTPFEVYLRDKGFANYQTTLRKEFSQLIQLVDGRAQAWFGGKEMLKYQADRHIEGAKVTFSKPFVQTRFYIAASRGFPASVKKAYQDTYQAMLADGTVKKIFARYK